MKSSIYERQLARPGVATPFSTLSDTSVIRYQQPPSGGATEVGPGRSYGVTRVGLLGYVTTEGEGGQLK